MEYKKIKRGDILLVNLEANPFGSEQGKMRPVLVIQNDIGNKYSPTLIVATITKLKNNKTIPTNVFLPKEISNLNFDSTIVCSQIRTIDKKRVVNKLFSLNNNQIISKINRALKLSLSLN